MEGSNGDAQPQKLPDGTIANASGEVSASATGTAGSADPGAGATTAGKTAGEKTDGDKQ